MVRKPATLSWHSRSAWILLLAIGLAGYLLTHATVSSTSELAAVGAYKASVQCGAAAYKLTLSSGIHLPGATACGLLQDLGQLFYHSEPPASPASSYPSTAYPLQVSANGRYLVDRNSVPFLLVGDSPQAMIGNLSEDEAGSFLANRHRSGFNSVWVNLLCNDYTGCNADGSTFDGIPPFSTPGDLATPNQAYFSRADRIISLAAKYGMNVFLDPIETGGWLGILKNNGPEAAYNYGRYVGERYRHFPNIVWLDGNDLQTWRDPEDDDVAVAVARGIRDADSEHLQTVELDFLLSSSADDPSWNEVIGLDSAYTYFPTYSEVLKDYNRPLAQPVILIEANYEFQHYYAGPQTLRRQEYWSLLAGAAGQNYGNKDTWPFKPGWQHRLDTIGSVEMSYVAQLFAQRRWYELVPDQTHSVITSGFGSPSLEASVNDSDYVTAARTADGSLVIAYFPTIRSVSIDMSQLAGPVRARWYDPAAGTYRPASESLVANRGSRDFQPPGQNSDGDDDWVLVLEVDDG